jgi:alanyl-tRNA synthetase
MLHDLAAIVANNLHDAYPELGANIKSIQSTIRQEEQRFDTVLSASLPTLEELLDRAATTGSPVPGDEAFKLYDTFGLPLDFIEDMASERKLAFDRASFDAAMEGQREKARAKSAFDGKKADDYAFASPESADRLRASKESFEGYTTTTVEGARILAVFDDKKQQCGSPQPGSPA